MPYVGPPGDIHKGLRVVCPALGSCLLAAHANIRSVNVLAKGLGLPTIYKPLYCWHKQCSKPCINLVAAVAHSIQLCSRIELTSRI